VVQSRSRCESFTVRVWRGLVEVACGVAMLSLRRGSVEGCGMTQLKVRRDPGKDGRASV
jgi:hypothetical protein